jgi:hypothetical protein
MSRLRIFINSYGDVTIIGEELHKLGLRALEIFVLNLVSSNFLFYAVIKEDYAGSAFKAEKYTVNISVSRTA